MGDQVPAMSMAQHLRAATNDGRYLFPRFKGHLNDGIHPEWEMFSGCLAQGGCLCILIYCWDPPKTRGQKGSEAVAPVPLSPDPTALRSQVWNTLHLVSDPEGKNQIPAVVR